MSEFAPVIIVTGTGPCVGKTVAMATIADVGSELTARGVNVGYVVVALAGQGTLNHSALTAEALRTRGLCCLGFVIGSWPQDPDLETRSNAHDLASVTGARLLGRVPAGAGQWGSVEFLSLIHISEPTRRTPISYAVFCLKK